MVEVPVVSIDAAAVEVVVGVTTPVTVAQTTQQHPTTVACVKETQNVLLRPITV
jgi:hypothetical protein